MNKPLLNILIFTPATFLIVSILLVYHLRDGAIIWTPLMLKREWQFRNTDMSSKQFWTPLQEISPDAVKAIVMSEDDRFLEHKGVDIQELREMFHSYRCGDKPLRGCSTITQQVAKNCFTLSTNTVMRKAIELYWASLLEIFWSKERILEVYLNIMEVGKGLYGIEAAAYEYFHCTAKNMTIHDAASLAVVLPSPLATTPNQAWGNSSDRIERLVVRLKRQRVYINI